MMDGNAPSGYVTPSVDGRTDSTKIRQTVYVGAAEAAMVKPPITIITWMAIGDGSSGR